jgi:hypothetical protein
VLPVAPAPLEREGLPGLSIFQWIELLLAAAVVVLAVLSLWVRRSP